MPYAPVACAVVDDNDNIINIIVADPAVDVMPAGRTLVRRPDAPSVDRWWIISAKVYDKGPALKALEAAGGSVSNGEGGV